MSNYSSIAIILACNILLAFVFPYVYGLFAKKIRKKRNELNKAAIDISKDCTYDSSKSTIAFFDTKFKNSDINVYYIKDDKFYFGNEDKIVNIKYSGNWDEMYNQIQCTWAQEK